MGDFRRRQSRLAADQNQVQPDREPRVRPGQLDRFVKRISGDHQAGAGKDAALVGLDYGPIHAVRESVVVAVDYRQASRQGLSFRGSVTFGSSLNHNRVKIPESLPVVVPDSKLDQPDPRRLRPFRAAILVPILF